MSKKKVQEAKRKAAFAASRPKKPVDNGMPSVTVVRWEKRRWTPFVDVTDYAGSALTRRLGLTPEQAMQVITAGRGGRMYENALYRVVKSPVTVETASGTATGYCLSIRSTDNEARHDWRHFQRIKNELCGLEFEAVEIYPRESRLVDTANQFYLWVLPEGVVVPFGFTQRLVAECVDNSGARQRPFDRDCRPADLAKPGDMDDTKFILDTLKEVEGGEERRHDEEEDAVTQGDRGQALPGPAGAGDAGRGAGRDAHGAGGQQGE